MSDLRKLAEAATPGPWKRTGYDREGSLVGAGEPFTFVVNWGVDWVGSVAPDSTRKTREQVDADGDYIAAVDPQTVLALLDRIDVLERMVKDEYPDHLTIDEIIATWGPGTTSSVP